MSGPPGAGKTTLARLLGDALFLPVVHRDVLKESLTRTLGVPANRSTSQDLGATSFDAFLAIIEGFVEHGVGVIAEAAYQQHPAGEMLGKLTAKARIVIVHCDLDEMLAVERYAERAHRGGRHECHTDVEVIDEMRRDEWGFARYAPPDLDTPRLTVDTTDGYDPPFDQIVAFIDDQS